MSSVTSSEETLRAENAELRARLEEMEETLRAIRAGEVDALVVDGDAGPQLFVLQSTDAEASRFRSDILAKVSEAVVAVDEDQKVVFLNAAAERQYEVTGSEVLGHPLAALYENRWFAPEDETRALATLRETGHWRGQSTHVKRSGGIIHVETSVSQMFAADGTPSGLLGVIRDITDRKQAEEELRRSEALYRAIGESINYGVWACAPDGRTTYASESFLKLVGLTQEQCSDFGWGDVLHPDDAAGTIAAWQECVRTGGQWDREHRIRGVDGEWHSVLARGVPVKDERGNIISWAGINLDISGLKRAENALRASEENYRGLIQSLPAAIYTCDREGRIQLFNAAAVELWGREPEVGKDLWCGSWRIYHPDGSPLDLAACPMARTLKDGKAVRGEEIIVERRNGTRRHVLPYPDPIFDAAGELVGAVNMLLDITERKQMETLLREAKDAAELANQSKDRFLAVLSHELRTPLTPVLMAVGALEHDPELRPDVREDLAMMKRNIELETKLIDDLLDLNRITSGKLVLEIEPVDLNEAVRHVCDICRSAVREGGIRLETKLDDAAGLVAADVARLQQVLWNVLKNAIKFTPEEGTIRVSTERLDASHCEVRVQDSGLGIPPEVLPRIFDAFEQGDASVTRQFGGLGLGLAICKALVDLHGGTIRAESTGAGHGSTFIVELPGAPPATAAKPAGLVPATHGQPPQLRLLVVEDHADTARTLSRLLRREAFAVSTAGDVASARAATEREPFDLLVSDLGLPDGSGYEIMRGVRAIRSIPGIAMSGYGMDEDVRRSREAGFTEHLVKPIHVPQLIAAIRRVTEDKRP